MVQFLLNVVVFISGGVLMALEIVGSRVLAPYFGSSIFVWGSLISVVMAALSLGYYWGGWLSAREPSRLRVRTEIDAGAGGASTGDPRRSARPVFRNTGAPQISEDPAHRTRAGGRCRAPARNGLSGSVVHGDR